MKGLPIEFPSSPPEATDLTAAGAHRAHAVSVAGQGAASGRPGVTSAGGLRVARQGWGNTHQTQIWPGLLEPEYVSTSGQSLVNFTKKLMFLTLSGSVWVVSCVKCTRSENIFCTRTAQHAHTQAPTSACQFRGVRFWRTVAGEERWKRKGERVYVGFRRRTARLAHLPQDASVSLAPCVETCELTQSQIEYLGTGCSVARQWVETRMRRSRHTTHERWCNLAMSRGAHVLLRLLRANRRCRVALPILQHAPRA